MEAVEELFGSLLARYGNTFRDKWAGGDAGAIKANWAYELRHYTPAQVRTALSLLAPHGFPPSLPEFVGYCNTARQQERAAAYKPLPIVEKVDPNSVVAKRIAAMARTSAPVKDWRDALRERIQTGECFSPGVYRQLKAAGVSVSMESEVL